MIREREKRRARARTLVRLLVLAIAVTLAFAVGPSAGTVSAENEHAALAASATEFARLFMNEQYDRLPERMTERMQTAMGPEAAAQIRRALIAQNGALERVGEGWMEDTVGGYRRFRVPVDFENKTIDLRVVFDIEGRVAGLFHVPHVVRPAAEPARSASADKAVPRPEVAGHWEGGIELPGMTLTVMVDLAQANEGWTGTCDIPMQGAEGLPLENVRVEAERVEFAIYGVPGAPTFRGRLADGKITGTFQQAGQSFPFELSREALARPARPQEPRPPFPYGLREVTFGNGEIQLAGTLSLPAGEGPFPAVLLISGSGPQDRNEEVFGHKPFLVLADYLTRRGVAVLRVDDRGVGGSSGSVNRATTEDLAGDARAGVRFLRSQSEIDPARVGLIGHSEGALIAPLVASRSDDVAFIVMLAGPGVPGNEILMRQLELISRAGGLGEEQLQRVLTEQRKLLDLLVSGASDDAVREQVRALVRAQMAGPAGEGGADADEAAAQAAERVLTPWFRFFVAHDPRPALGEVRVPALVLNGELDLQVDPKQNVPAIEQALAENPDVTTRVLPGLNHLFQTATTGSPNEYYTLEETFAPAALETVGDWILQRFGKAAARPEG